MPDQIEAVVSVPLDRLRPFPNHPFKVRDDDAMKETVESMKQFGILVPAIVRPVEGGDYEIVAGHRRAHAAELAGISEMPAIVREMDDDSAVIFMVDSNLQREDILPSERAAAYKMKLEAIKRRAGRPSRDAVENGVQVEHHFSKKKSIEIIADNMGESSAQVRRYIRLTELHPELQEMVDKGKIGLTPAVELSYLKPEEQAAVIETIDSEQAVPSLSQAQRMKKLSQEGKLDEDSVLSIMSEQKKPEAWNISLPIEKLQKYFPRSYTPQRMEETIFKLLEGWVKRRQQNRER